MIYRTIVDAFKEIRFLVVRKLKLRDNLLAEARDADEDRDFAHMLPRRRGNFKSILHRSAWFTVLRVLHAQHGVHEAVKLDLMSAYVKEYVFIIFR